MFFYSFWWKVLRTEVVVAPQADEQTISIKCTCKIFSKLDKSRHPKDKSRHPKDKSRHPKDKSRHPKDNSRHPKDKSKHPTDK